MSKRLRLLLGLGLLIVAASIAQLFLVGAFGTDPNSNHLGNGLLTYFGCIVGAVVMLSGAALSAAGWSGSLEPAWS